MMATAPAGLPPVPAPGPLHAVLPVLHLLSLVPALPSATAFSVCPVVTGHRRLTAGVPCARPGTGASDNQ